MERLNDHAPTHSRIFKEVRAFPYGVSMSLIFEQMILVSSPSKPFTYTAKGTARRQAVIADYEDEINAMYTTVAKSTSEDIAAPEHWTHPLTMDFIRKTVSRVLNSSVDDGVDLFQHGCDRYCVSSYSFSVQHADGDLVACKPPGYEILLSEQFVKRLILRWPIKSLTTSFTCFHLSWVWQLLYLRR